MKLRIARRGAAADFELTAHGLLQVRWRGVVTAAAAEELKREIVAALPDQPRGVLSDYRRAALAMNEREMLGIMVGGPHDLPELPAAVLANDAVCHDLYQASIAAAWAGRWRYVSPCAKLAHAWVSRRTFTASPFEPAAQGHR